MEYHKCLMLHKKTLKETSKNNAPNNTNREFMTNNDRVVICYDDVVGDYCRRKRMQKLKSNDALVFDFEKVDTSNDINFLFIEFKSGDINSDECDKLHLKIIDSNEILKQIVNEVDDNYLLHKVNYILVYDLSRQTYRKHLSQFKEEPVFNSMSKAFLVEQFSALSKKNIYEKIFPYKAALGLDEYEGVVLNAVKSIEVNRFNYYLEKGYITENMFS